MAGSTLVDEESNKDFNFASNAFNARHLKKGVEEKVIKKRFESVGVKLEIKRDRKSVV